LTLAQFKALEPDFEILEGFAEVETEKIHYVVDRSTDTQMLPPEGRESILGLCEKIEVYEQALEPTPIDLSDYPDIAGFRVAMLSVESFNLWAENLPNSLRENLKLAAVVGNLEVVGALLQQALTLNPPSEENMIEWQIVLDQYRIPITLPLD
jgi:hypothetical protein